MPDYAGEICRHVCPICGGCDICCGGCMLPGEGLEVLEADPDARAGLELGQAFAEAINGAQAELSARAEAHRALARRRAASPRRGGHEHR